MVNKLPWPTSEQDNPATAASGDSQAGEAWVKVRTAEQLPMMFQLRMGDGRLIGLAYADLRETRFLNGGHLELFLYGMQKTKITIRGRRLQELASLIVLGRIRMISQSDGRELERAEDTPVIDEIAIEYLVDP